VNVTANATVEATPNTTDAPEGHLTGVTYKECTEKMETMDAVRVKPKSTKKETTIENKKIK